jgi:V/A-type H+/Na+-transporting ATPase subunit G/H
MKSDVLKSIKTTEEAFRTMIGEAEAERRRSIQSAELEADNLILKAGNNAEEYKKLRLADARQQAAATHAEIIRAGDQRAAELKERGSKNLDKAVELLVSRFKEQLHVNA